MATAAGLVLVGNAQAAIVNVIDPVGGERDITIDQTDSATRISRASMQTLIQATGDLTRAGVFDAQGFTGTTNRSFNAEGAAYTDLVFNLTGATRYGRGDGAGTSGDACTFISVSETWTFTPDPGVLVTHFGLAIVAHATEGPITVTVNYSGGGNDSYTAPAAAGGPAHWAGFIAPAGQTVTTVAITEPSGGNFASLDDISFVTIPEPSSAALLGSAVAGLLVVRRRRD